MVYRVSESLLFFVVTLSVSAAPLAAQILYGSVVGNVKDPTNAAVAGASVVATNKETNQSRETASNETGGFSFSTLQPGAYEIRVTKDAVLGSEGVTALLASGRHADYLYAGFREVLDVETSGETGACDSDAKKFAVPAQNGIVPRVAPS